MQIKTCAVVYRRFFLFRCKYCHHYFAYSLIHSSFSELSANTWQNTLHRNRELIWTKAKIKRNKMMNDGNATARLNAQIELSLFCVVRFFYIHIVNLLTINEHGNRYLSRKKNWSLVRILSHNWIEKYNPNDDDNNCHLNSTHSWRGHNAKRKILDFMIFRLLSMATCRPSRTLVPSIHHRHYRCCIMCAKKYANHWISGDSYDVVWYLYFWMSDGGGGGGDRRYSLSIHNSKQIMPSEQYSIVIIIWLVRRRRRLCIFSCGFRAFKSSFSFIQKHKKMNFRVSALTVGVFISPLFFVCVNAVITINGDDNGKKTRSGKRVADVFL